MRLPACAGLALSLCFLAIGCAAQGNDAPILDFVDSPIVVSAGNGEYRVPITIGFHDNDSDLVTRVHYRLPPSIDEIVEITTPIPTRQTADVVLVLPSPMPGSRDPRQVEITIIDGRGAESRPLSQIVTFQ